MSGLRGLSGVKCGGDNHRTSGVPDYSEWVSSKTRDLYREHILILLMSSAITSNGTRDTREHFLTSIRSPFVHPGYLWWAAQHGKTGFSPELFFPPRVHLFS